MNPHMKTILAVAVMIAAPFLHAAARPVAGEQRRWSLSFRTRMEQPGARPIEIALAGDWISTVSAIRPGEYDAALELANFHLSTPAKPIPADQQQALERRLQRTFWATYRNDGSLAAMHFYKDSDPGDRNLLEMIATECQFVQAPAERASWTVGERDGAGEYAAAYSRADAHTVIKHKVKYGAADAGIEIDQSEVRLLLDSDGGIAGLDSVFHAHLGKAVTVITEVHLSGLRKSQAPEIAGSLVRAHQEVASFPIGKHQTDDGQARARLDSQILEGYSSEWLLSEAFAATRADQLLADRLAALFRQRPEAAAAAVERLRKRGPSVVLTDALGAAGSPAALQALSAVAGDRTLGRALRIDALTAFVQMQKPTVGAMRAPGVLFDDPDVQVAAAAGMAAGSLARAGRVEHPQEAAAIDAALVARYRKAQGAGEKVELLAAMGNSTGRLVAPVIEAALRDGREAVRAAAARALRLAAGPEVEGLLAATIASDGDASVRAAAIFSVSFRKSIGPKLVEALMRAEKSDPAEQVRSSATALLRQHSGETR